MVGAAAVEEELLHLSEQPHAKIVVTKPRKIAHTIDAGLVVRVEAMIVLPTSKALGFRPRAAASASSWGEMPPQRVLHNHSLPQEPRSPVSAARLKLPPLLTLPPRTPPRQEASIPVLAIKVKTFSHSQLVKYNLYNNHI